jgi:hypothetical protein
LKGYRLWAMGQLDSTCSAPPRQVPEELLLLDGVLQRQVIQDVAVQVAFERQTLKPVFHFIGYRLWV